MADPQRQPRIGVTQQFESMTVDGAWRSLIGNILESIREGIYGVDLNGRCVFINRAGAELLGYAPEQLLGRNMHELIHHSHADGRPYPVEECPIFEAFRSNSPCRIDGEVLWRADGSNFAAEYASCPIMDDGVIAGAVVTFVDITARKHAEECQRRSRDELERRVAERTAELSSTLDELGHTTERLRELSAHAESACEADRSRIAREIHDELGSVLVALKLDLSWLRLRLSDRDDLAAKTVAMTRLIDKAVEEVGRIITDLRPSILDHQGLWAAMEWYAQEFVDNTGLRDSLSFDVGGVEPPAGDLATAAYRIFQEMLSNVARHSRATAVSVRVEAQPHLLSIEVEDNGLGITHEQIGNPRSYGLIGMYERARHYHGHVSVGPALLGSGTRVCVQLPLKDQSTREQADDSTTDL